MRGKYFRFLFENLDGGLFHTGSIYDKKRQKNLNFVYMTGNRFRSMPQNESLIIYKNEKDLPEVIDILVIGSYNAGCINKLMEILKNHKIKTIILPYLAPIQRIVLGEEIKEHNFTGKVATRFLQDPYQFLKRCGIENVCFLSGNGAPITRRPEEMDKTICFEQADAERAAIIREMEGYSVPVMCAGYMVKQDCLFYFGVYGLDLRLLAEFTKDYFSHIENIPEVSENANEDYRNQMQRLIREFLRKFGFSSMHVIVMFEGMLHASPFENTSYMTEQEFSKGKTGEMKHACRKTEDCSCMIRCTYGRDHDLIQNHKDPLTEPRFGVLLLGNINLNRYLPQIRTRFQAVIPRIRAVTLPNSGSGEDWNHQILNILRANERIYWICSKHDMTSAGVISDIVLSSPSNRFLTIDSNWGCCLSGYLIPKEDMD